MTPKTDKRRMKFSRHGDSAYLVTSYDPHRPGTRRVLGVARKLTRTRWLAVTLMPPQDAAEFGTRRTAAAWLEEQQP